MTASTTRQKPATKRRIGRPRASGESSQPPGEAILEASRKLFRSQGYAGTSTRQIAAAAGLRQPSLFHHFDSKRAILQTIIDLVMEPELAFISADVKRDLAPDVALYRYARFVHYNLATNPNVIGSPLQFPETGTDEYSGFWRAYRRIFNTLKRHIRLGVNAGLFVKVDVNSASEQIFALLESPLGRDTCSPAQGRKAAGQAAELVLRGMLKDPARLAAVKAAADKI